MDFRKRGWGLLLVPIALQYALLTTQRVMSLIEVAAAAVIVALAPRVAAKAVPFALVILGLWGVNLVRDLEWGTLPPVQYGIVPAGDGLWFDRLVLPEALFFVAAGAWLFLRVCSPGSARVRVLARRLAAAVAGRPSRRAWLLLPVLALAVEVLGLRHWLGFGWWSAEWTLLLTPVLAVGAVLLIFRAPSVAAVTAVTGLQILGVYGIILGAIWRPSMPGQLYGVVGLNAQFDTRARRSSRAWRCSRRGRS